MEASNKVKTSVILVVLLLGLGTFVYPVLEGWSFIDSLYFSTTTLTTIGYGDLHPTNPITKLFTVFYILSGVSLVLYALTNINTHYYEMNKLALSNRFNALKSALRPEKKPDKWVVLQHKKPKHFRYFKKHK